MLAVRARALLDGRLAPSIDDVLALAEPVLKHRMALTFAARADGETIRRRDRQAEGADRIVDGGAAAPTSTRSTRSGTRAAKARTLAATLPRLILEARRIAATVIHGLHGRRRAGPGENFWQYRRFVSGEPARRVDWRRSARDDHLYVREQEWEAAHTVWIWPDRSPSMAFASQLAQRDQARARAGGHLRARRSAGAGRRARRHSRPDARRPAAATCIDKMAQAIMHDAGRARRACRRRSRPRRCPRSWCCRISGARSPEIRTTLAQLSAAGAHGHVVQIVDPAEETFPYSGRIEFIEPEGAGAITAGRAETWRGDYEARVARHRAEIRAETDRLGWSFIIHRTDRPATELLLALHARMGAGARTRSAPQRRSRASGGARMIAGLPLAFAQPLVLLGLLSLPVLWWLLRLMPPRPRRIDFPPTRLLFDIAPKEETPARTPWWLTLLRLTLAALVILAAAGPMWNPPVATVGAATAPLVLLIDDGWARPRPGTRACAPPTT